MGEVDLAYVSRGSKSRNKVSVGEPAEGSVPLWCVVTGCHCLALEIEATVGGVRGSCVLVNQVISHIRHDSI